MGFIRFGQRTFNIEYPSNPSNPNTLSHFEITCNTIVDMYVHYLSQRQGIGKMLIDRVLRFMEMAPQNFALYLPTRELLKFFHKNYMINDFVKVDENFSISRRMVRK